ncbi:MAG: TolC family protein [Gemmataceae bacterium]
MQTALQRNPEVQARASRVAAIAERVPQVTALPDPMLADTFWPISGNAPQTAMGRGTNELMLAQRFPWCGKLRLRGLVAETDTQIALTELAATQLKVIEEVKATYYEIYFYQQAIDITEHDEKLLGDFVKFAEARYKVGQSSQQDVLRAQVEVQKVKDQLIRLQRDLREAQADLGRLLSIPPETDLRAADGPGSASVPEELEQLYQLALETRPELQGRMQAVLRDRQLIDLAHLEYYPDVSVGVTWGTTTTAAAMAPTANGNDMVGFTFGVNLPIWRRKLNAGVREAENRTNESARIFDATRDDTFRQIRRLTVQAHALEQQVALYRDDIIPKAEQTLKTSSADYRVGKVDMLTLLDNWSELLRFQVQLVRLEASLAQVLASLERVVGTELTRLPQSVETE